MTFTDTGRNFPETAATLALQQAQMMAGRRAVQMFPVGTPELPLPPGIDRHQNARGIFHFRSDAISAEAIDALSANGSENEFLNLGPHSKPDIARRISNGERSLTVTEYTPAGVEMRSAAGTDKTVNAQLDYFERTKEPGNVIVVDDLASVIGKRLAG